MPERVTRAQAEAAMSVIRQCLLVSDAPSEAYEDAVLSLRAYLAQRPDEETVRKGHEALDGIAAAEYVPDDRSWEESVAQVRAAMYQPEEEAR